ncbi:dTDP-3-amino-3,4,6-trideoxy-alpha-D-glucopyranose [Anatilimnocola aggregata]|uniref:dTDP-3-amino-3,4, 6-trideoxy-alpha-D-glucopyranose n=1 Tax=Anatilimnocola aggregata TaxID=2528021 RepID=A0A517YHX5_9BACT|nr:class I SAM-dependent methyltransferase [Anatilimnocola aggregata]QDU29819.1 dTDP-3-amino-3,4,6-trideoxy-alpha-D-glucopyranose [Anatilimnocola aggregata]
MEQVSGNLYDYPIYYDLVFGSDWKAEFDFLRQVFNRFGGGNVQRVFEPACGTGRLLYRLADAGLDVCGLDLNPRAVEFCNKRLLKHGYEASVICGDMCDFKLPKKVDAAFNTINSFRHLLSEAQAEAHLRCVAESLKAGGLYVLGLHLTPTAGEPMTEESWSARRGNLAINTHLATMDLDRRKRTERCRMKLDIYTPTERRQIVDELVFRTYTRDQIQKLLETVGVFDIAETFDFSYRIDSPIEIDRETQDVVFILRKKRGSK